MLLFVYSSVITDYNKGDSSKKELTHQAWIETKEKLLKILQDFAQKVIHDPGALKKYSMSRKYPKNNAVNLHYIQT